MKAAFFTGPKTIELADIENPQLPVDGCIIAVKAAAICGSDLRRWREGPISKSEPVIPGHEIAGTVIRVGNNCHAVKVGDRLALGPDVHCGACWYCEQGMYNLCDYLVLYGITPGRHGGFAEQMALPGELLAHGVWHRIPKDLSDEAAALAEPCASVISC
ncbi:MAG: alcohol dehydrogenase catalytic domain-containing protein, partial [candidate division KSB1 bacterium]|nr:alcohol dehydrogenase catalytic domain-containing protein [candidate division KSB1 bacterium]